jgi:hypothetical protein
MTFTDEYLNLEKQFLDERIGQLVHIPEWKMRALIDRLEAAEAMEKPLQAFLSFQGEQKRDIYCMDGMERTKYLVAEEKIKNWRKIAGK